MSHQHVEFQPPSKGTTMTCKAVFLGSKTLGLRVLECLFSADRSVNWTIIHPDDTGDARSMLDAFNDFARTNNLDMLIAASGPAAREMLRDGKYDVAFVCGWYWLFAEHDLSLTRLGFYGIHNSPLPKYRGGIAIGLGNNQRRCRCWLNCFPLQPRHGRW